MIDARIKTDFGVANWTGGTTGNVPSSNCKDGTKTKQFFGVAPGESLEMSVSQG